MVLLHETEEIYNMFGNVLYYDKKKLNEYQSIIKGKRNLEINEYDITNDKGAKVDLKAFGIDINAIKAYKAKIQESLLLNCDEFEKSLNGRDDYYDFTISSEYDITTMRRGSIIKFDGYIKVPEEFDLIQTIDKFKPMLIESMTTDEMEKSEQDALRKFLSSTNAKIPVFMDLDEQLLCSKILSENLLIEYEELEEYDELEVTILARITSSNLVNATKAFYDPLKDFMTLNRAMRRNMGDRSECLREIFAEVDYRTIEIIAIYQ